MSATDHLVMGLTLLFMYVIFSAPHGMLLFSMHHLNPKQGNHSFLDKNHTGKKVPSLTTNYASQYLGAAVINTHKECQGGSALVSGNADKYMICPCAARRKQFTVQLIRDVEVHMVAIQNSEQYSSGVRNFTLLGARKYPTNSWVVLGHFEAENRGGRQFFDVQPQPPVRFIKFLWSTSYGTEPWCTMTSLQVFGIDVLETLTRYGEEDEDDADSSSGAEDQSSHHGKHERVGHPQETAPPNGVGITEDRMNHRVRTPESSDAEKSEQGTDSMNRNGKDKASPLQYTHGKVEIGHGVFADLSATFESLLQTATSESQPKNPPNGSAQFIHWAKYRNHSDAVCCYFSPKDVLNESGTHVVIERPDISLCHYGMCSYAPKLPSLPPNSGTITALATSSSKGGTKPPYQNAAVSLLAQLIKQQKSVHQDLLRYSRREAELTEELAQTKRALESMDFRFRHILREAAEQRERINALRVDIQFWGETMQLEAQGRAAEGGRSGTAAVALAALACIMSAVAVVLVSITVFPPPSTGLRISGGQAASPTESHLGRQRHGYRARLHDFFSPK